MLSDTLYHIAGVNPYGTQHNVRYWTKIFIAIAQNDVNKCVWNCIHKSCVMCL